MDDISVYIEDGEYLLLGLKKVYRDTAKNTYTINGHDFPIVMEGEDTCWIQGRKVSTNRTRPVRRRAEYWLNGVPVSYDE